MTKIKATPYAEIEEINFINDVNFTIENNDFNGISFQEGKGTLVFSGCLFKTISIFNEENIDFEDVSIMFMDCYIERIEIEIFESKNISIHFSNTILSGRIDNINLKAISFNNCVVEHSLFLLHQNHIEISYTEENIFPIVWKKFLLKIGAKYLDIISHKQSYFIYDSKKIIFRTSKNKTEKRGIYRHKYEKLHKYQIGYFLKDDEKKLLNISLYLQYSVGVEHIQTKIIDSNLTSLSLNGYANGEVVVENTKIENWYIREFSTQNGADFYIRLVFLLIYR